MPINVSVETMAETMLKADKKSDALVRAEVNMIQSRKNKEFWKAVIVALKAHPDES